MMSRITFLLIVACGGSLLVAQAATRPTSVTLQKKVVKVGQVLELSTKVDAEQKLESPMGAFELTQKESTKRRLTVLAMAGAVPSRIKVEYVEGEKSQVTPNGEVQEEDPLRGRWFVVEKNKTGHSIKESGKVDADQTTAKLVRENVVGAKGEFKDFVDQIGEVVPGRKFEIGKEVTLSGDQARRIFGNDDDETQVRKMTLTAKGTRTIEGSQVLDLECSAVLIITGKADAASHHIDCTLEGTISVGLDGWLRSMDVKGPMKIRVTIGEGEQSMNMNGTGTMKIAGKSKVTHAAKTAKTENKS